MNILELENQKTILQQKLEETFSCRRKLIYISDFYDLLFSSTDSAQIEPYIFELIEEYLLCFEQFEINGIHPKITSRIITQAKKLKSFEFLQNYSEKINQNIDRAEEDQRRLKNILEGELNNSHANGKAFFPVLEDCRKEDEIDFGTLESITVIISLAKNETKFIIVPSGKEIESRIGKQIKTFES